MPAQVVHVAARLGIADELANGQRTAAEIAAATATHLPSLRRLLRALTCVGVVAETEPDRFELAPGGRQLRSDVPDSIRSSVLFFCSEEMWRTWSQLEHTVRTGENAWDHVFGMNIFEYMDQHPDKFDTFNAAMADRTRTVAPQIVASYDFSRFDKLVDVGGGNGQLLAMILDATPTLQGVLFDYPVGIEAADATLRAAGVADRCEVVAGDFFAAVPEGAGAYLLKSVLHDWGDEESTTILRSCRKAIPDDGTLLVVDRILPSRVDSSAGRGVFSDINVLVNSSGKERTEEEFRSLYAAAGFELTDVVATSPDPVGYQVLVGTPV